MKFKKTLLVLTHDADAQILIQTVQLCKHFGSKLFALFIIETSRMSRLASITHQKIDNLHKKIEEEGWRMLYLLEDEAVEKGVWTSLHLEEGNSMNIIKKYIESYKIDLICIEKKNETKKIFISSSVPVIGL